MRRATVIAKSAASPAVAAQARALAQSQRLYATAVRSLSIFSFRINALSRLIFGVPLSAVAPTAGASVPSLARVAPLVCSAESRLTAAIASLHPRPHLK
jgi:hypothetical protein